jgi:hypothetical protein
LDYFKEAAIRQEELASQQKKRNLRSYGKSLNDSQLIQAKVTIH